MFHGGYPIIINQSIIIMVYNICFISKTKRTYIYKQYHEINILSVLKTLQCKRVRTLRNKFITFI